MPTYSIPVNWVWDKSSKTQQAIVNIPNMESFVGENANILNAKWGSISGSFTPVHFYKGSGQNEDSTGVRSWGLDSRVDNVEQTQTFNYTLWWETQTYFSYTMDEIKVIPKVGDYIVKCRDYNGFTGPNKAGEVSNQWDMAPSVGFNVSSVIVAQPTNIKQNQTAMYKDISITFDLPKGNIFDYQVLENGILRQNGTNLSNRSIIIKAGALKSKNASVVITSKVGFMGGTYAAAPITYKLTLEELSVATVDNFRVVGVAYAIEDSILFDWELLNATEGAVNTMLLEFWQEGIKVHQAITTEELYYLPPNTLNKTATLTVRYKSTTTYNGYTADMDLKSFSLNNLISLKPIIVDFELSGVNRDYDITVSPNCTGADKYRVNGKSGLLIPKGTLLNGSNSITLEAIKLTSDNREVISVLTKSIDVTQDNPEIYSLEPNGININISTDVPITFVVNERFFDTFKLYYSNQVINGTLSRKHIVAPGVFNGGYNTIKVEASYTPKYAGATTRTVSKTVNFYGFGKPSKPSITESTVYKSPLPTISWNTLTSSDSEIQSGYRILIKQGNTIIESVEKQGVLSEHKLTHELQNHTSYSIELNVQNKYFLWSDTLKHTFETNFNELPVVGFDLFENGNSVLVKTSLDGTIPQDFEQLKVYRKENKEWVLLADKLLTSDIVVDTAVRTMVPVEYKVRLYDKHGAFSESDTKEITLKKSSFIFALPPKLEESFEVKYISSTISYVTDKRQKLFAKRRAPKTYKGNIQYATLQLTVTIKRAQVQEFINLLDNECLLYRDIRGNKYYVNGTVEGKKPVNFIYDELSVILIETEYDETLMFAAESLRKVALLDGVAQLDGSMYLRGQSSW